jgi:3-hydroxyisobutyrate dehydrogenase-like beta-hydroxyacid dehydrogenase
MSTYVTPTLGFVGLGHMGGNMAARLPAAGYQVDGHARHREWPLRVCLEWLLGGRVTSQVMHLTMPTASDGLNERSLVGA